jgi:hypothetical protein
MSKEKCRPPGTGEPAVGLETDQETFMIELRGRYI